MIHSIRQWSVAIHTVIALLSFAVQCLGGTVREKAVAAVVVVNVMIDIGDEQPVLPDTTNNFPQAVPVPQAEFDELQARLLDKTYEVSQLRIALSTMQPKSTGQPTLIPMAMSVTQSSGPVGELLPAQLVIGNWSSGCVHCERLKRDIIRELKPLGWSIGESETDQIRFTIIGQDQAAPQITLLQQGREIQHWTGYQSPSDLSRALRDAWDSNERNDRSIASSGVAGSIRASAQIRQVFEWWRANIGEGVKASARWDRSGAQSFPLLAKGDWSALALFGKHGHIELSAKGAKTPVDSFGFGYRIDGDDMTFDADPLTIQGLAASLGMHSPSRADPLLAAPVPSQFGPMTIISVLSVIRDIWCLLHPSADLQIGGCVTCSAMLDGDRLVVDFEQMPSIKLVALFTFQLGVRQVIISPSNVHVEFSGSRFVKSRDFSVE